MKKMYLLICILASMATICMSQTTEQIDKLNSIKDLWKIDNNNNLTYTRVVDSINSNKNDIFNRALGYFAYNYKDANSVLQVKDKESGIIVGKGYFKDFCSFNMFLCANIFSAYHILRVDVKDNKARIILSVDQYNTEFVGSKNSNNHSSINLIDTYPIKENGPQKKMYTKAFLGLHDKCIETLDRAEKALKEGNTSSSIENNNW